MSGKWRSPRRPELTPGVAETLGYLADLGYRDLYLGDGAEEAPAETAPKRGAAAPGGDAVAPVREADPDRVAALATLKEQVAACTACGLAQGRTNTVFGDGSPTADLMFIGEGPGFHEDKQGVPFVGRAGELLNRIIAAIELRREDVYIANIVKCRPPNNRDPQPDEVSACIGYLERQVELVAPRVIVCLGRVAAQTLLGTNMPLGRMRGQWWSFQEVPVRATYHPAALLRNTALKRPTWEDMQLVRDRLAAP